MSPADRRDLARRGLARRLSPVLLGVLLVLGVLAALQIGSMLSFRTGLDARLLFSPPPLHPVPIGTSWVPLFTIAFPGGAAYATCAAVLVGAATGSALLVRSMRRA